MQVLRQGNACWHIIFLLLEVDANEKDTLITVGTCPVPALMCMWKSKRSRSRAESKRSIRFSRGSVHKNRRNWRRHPIYGVWALNVKSAAKIKTDPLGTLLPSTTLSKEELKLGIVCATGEVAAKDQTKDEILSLFRNATEEEMNGVNDIKDEDLGVLFAVVSDMPQFCVLCVQDAYYLNGGVESAQTALESAKAAIKEIEAMNVEPEGMEALKNIYVATSAYLDFCLNVKGSLLQTSDTINEYRTTVKTAMSELDLIY